MISREMENICCLDDFAELLHEWVSLGEKPEPLNYEYSEYSERQARYHDMESWDQLRDSLVSKTKTALADYEGG